MPDLFSSFSIPATLWLPTAALAGVLLDRLLGEVRHGHPLIAFGHYASALEKIFNRGRGQQGKGMLAWMLAVLPWVALAAWGKRFDLYGWLTDAALLYFALGGRSLAEHAERVGRDLDAGNLAAARTHVGWIVSRDTSTLDESGVSKACVESTLENGNDAIFGACSGSSCLAAPAPCSSAWRIRWTPCGVTRPHVSCILAAPLPDWTMRSTTSRRA